MTRRIFGLLLLTILYIKATASIEIRSRQITIADGLANNSVRHIMQDSKGFLWMGTLNGLNRYDGNSFISYYPSSDDPLSLADRKIYDLEEDHNGFLWIHFSSEQYSCYDLKSARFVDYTGRGEHLQKYSKMMIAASGDVWLWHDGNGARRVRYQQNGFISTPYKVETGNLMNNRVRFIVEGNKGKVWIGSASGLLCIDGEQETIVNNGYDFTHALFHEGKSYFLNSNKEVFEYDETKGKLIKAATLPVAHTAISGNMLMDNNWIIFTSEGVYGFDFATKQLKVRADLFGENLPSGNVLTDNKGNNWVYNHSGKVWYVDAKTGLQKVFTLIPSEKLSYIDYERYRIVHDSRNIIWISTYGNGLFAYDINKDELTHFTAAINGFSYIGSDYLLGVMEDRSGEIWVSAEYAGVSRISVINEGSYRYFPENPTLLDRSNTIRLVSRINDEEIWIGTRRGGLYVYDLDFNLRYSRKDFHSNIYAVAKDAAGKIWVGSRGDGLSIDGRWYKNNPADLTTISNNNIFCIYRDKADRMWVGAFGGGLDLAEPTKDGYHFRHFFTKGYGQRQIRSICEDRNGMMWVGTSDGVYVFHPDTIIASPDKYYHFNYASGGLGSNEVKYLYPDSRGNIWIATSGAGFSICSPSGDYNNLTFEHYSTTDGLCHDMVQAIVEDMHGNIWLATEYGISKFNYEARIFENYYFSAYSQGNVYTESSVARLDNGNILFGSNYGFVVFDPDVVNKTLSTFPVIFTNFNVNGINMLPGDAGSPLTASLAYSDKVSLKHNQNSIIIDFSSFNYADAGQTKYSYKLVNYDKDWSTPSTLSFASYKMLPPGRYELMVRSVNGSGAWSDSVSNLKIVIAPPFYLTYWAFLIYTLLLGIALFFAFRITRNFNRLNNKIAVEKQLTEYKLVFFTNISHEFRTPLTLIQGALERIRRTETPSKSLSYPLQTMEKSTKRMIRLIDQLLEFRKMQNNKLALSLEKTDVVAMLYEIFLSFEDMAESKNMDFQFIPSVTSYKMFIDKGKLDKITYNLLSNAFKYTPQGGKVCLYVNIDTDAEYIEIRVSDTGVGIPKEKQNELFKRFMQSNFSGESVGIGLHLTHELVQVHKGQIRYVDNEGGGSVFIVNLPLGTDVYEEKDFLVANNILQQEKQGAVIEEEKVNEAEPLFRINPLNKQKILVIEDDIDVRQYLKEELSVYFQVEVADNGNSGFQMAQEVEPDLIVCDVLMPGMNGYEVTRKLKTEFNTSHIPVILLTALSLPENHLEGIESGADAYLSKPFSLRLLLTRIIKLLEQRERLKEKFSEEPGIVRSAVYASERDKEFVDKLQRILIENLGNSAFSIDEFASLMNIGRTVFYKKVKGVTGYSPNEYLRIMRMKKAAELLLEGDLTVSEVSYKVGIDDPFYFSKCFKTQFGVAPSVYQKGK